MTKKILIGRNGLVERKNRNEKGCIMKEALIIIDVQNDYFPEGTCELYHPYDAEKVIQELISESRNIGRPIIYIQHFNEPGDYFFLEGTIGAEISDRIAPKPEDKIIVKRYPNSFLETIPAETVQKTFLAALDGVFASVITEKK